MKAPILTDEQLDVVFGKADIDPDRDMVEAQRDADHLHYMRGRAEEMAGLFTTIETMYPELREVYWSSEDWQEFKSRFLEGSHANA